MSFSVSLNPDSCDRYFRTFFASHPDVSPQLADDLLRDFELYKRYGRKPDYFGRDCRYDRPESIISSEIYHIHLDLVSTVPFNGQRVQFRQVSDTALVYTRGFFNEDAYSILAVLEPAHTMASAGNNALIRTFQHYADTFRNQN